MRQQFHPKMLKTRKFVRLRHSGEMTGNEEEMDATKI